MEESPSANGEGEREGDGGSESGRERLSIEQDLMWENYIGADLLKLSLGGMKLRDAVSLYIDRITSYDSASYVYTKQARRGQIFEL